MKRNKKYLLILVHRRNVGAGSAANVGHEPLLLFPAATGTTPEPTTATSVTVNNNKGPDPRLELLYKQLGCMNIGSSAAGDPHKLKVFGTSCLFFFQLKLT